MNAHTPFDANQDWTNPYCRNSSNDSMVDALLGNAYHVVRTVYCNLGYLKHLYDLLNQYGMVLGVQSETELKALTTDAKYVRIYGFSRAGDRQVTDYLYVEGDRTGIIPDDPEATGSWITVATSGSNSGGTSSGEGAYIPWVYNKGSAVGGETSINVPDGTVGVPFIIINGDMQYVGRGFEFNADNLSVSLAQPLEEGDEVVLLLTGVPALPDNPNVNDWVQINWLYNNGAAVGGEQAITIPYTFQSIPAVYKNGLRLYKGLVTESYAADPDNQRILLTEPLATNDRLIVQIGGEVQVLEVVDRTIQEVARATNQADSQVILSTDTTQALNGKTVVYDVIAQKAYGLPTLPTNIYISSVSNGKLTYSPGNVTVNLQAPPNSAEILEDTLTSTNGASSVNTSTGENVESRLGTSEQTIKLVSRMGIPLDDRRIVVNAHRGFSETYFEQTLMAYSQCDAEALEIDMQTTSDGHAVCFHDDDLSIQTVTGTGAVKDNTLSTIQGLRFKRALGTKYEDMINIPTLASVCSIAKRRGKRLLAEIKGYRTIDDCALYNQTIGQYGLNPSTTYICFDFAPLQYIRNLNKESGFSWVIASYDSSMDSNIAKLASWGGCGISVSKNILSTIGIDKIREWESMGLVVTAWTIYTQQELDIVLSYGIRSVTIDKDFTSSLN